MSKLQAIYLGVVTGLFVIGASYIFTTSTPTSALSLGAQISVPSAPGAGYYLVSTSTGNYFATTSWPLIAGTFYGTSTATSSINGPLVLGQNSRYPYLQIGSTTPPDGNGIILYNMFNIIGNSNDSGLPVEGGIMNLSPGANADTFWYFNNDLTDNTITHYSGFEFNSSNFSDNAGGTGLAVPNQLSMMNTDGPITFMATSSNMYINFLTGGAHNSNERVRITNKGLGIATTSPGTALGVQGNMFIAGNITSTSTLSNVFPYASTTALTAPTLYWTNATGTALSVTNLISCDTIDTDSSGNLKCGTDATGAGGGTYPFTPTTWAGIQVSATSTSIWDKGSIGFIASSSIIDNASSTAISTSYASSTQWWGGGLLTTCNSGNVLTWANGQFGCAADQTSAGGSTFSTTSTDYWRTQRDLFSTTSSAYFLSQYQGAAFSTTSADVFLSQRNLFSTTSTDFWRTQRDFFSSSTATYFIDGSTTIPKLYTTNRYATNTLQYIPYASSTALTVGALFSINATTTALTVSNLISCNTIDTDALGNLKCGTDETGAGGAAFPFTPTINFNALTNSTSTAIWFQAGFQSSSTIMLTGDIAISSSTRITLNGSSIFTATSTTRNTLAGVQAGATLLSTSTDTTSANFTTAFGYRALASATSSSYTTAIGALALENSTAGKNGQSYGGSNTAVGMTAGRFITYGQNNTLVGSAAGLAIVNGNNNVSLGVSTLDNIDDASSSIAIGYGALGGQPIAGPGFAGNIGIGYGVGNQLTTGSYNTIIGHQADYPNGLSTGSYNILIGQNVAATSSVANATLNIGNAIFGTNIYSRLTSYAGPLAAARVGIATTSPAAAFGVQGDMFIAGRITSTSTLSSIFPYASTTVLSAGDLFSTNATSTWLFASFASTTQLSAQNATTTLLFSSFLSSTFSSSTFATTTTFATQVASTSLLYGAQLRTCNGGNVLTWNAGQFGCTTDQTGGGFAFPWDLKTVIATNTTFSTTTLATTTSIWTKGAFFASSTLAASQLPYATSTSATIFSSFYAAINGGAVGIATSTPWGLLSINASGLGSNPAFVIGTTTTGLPNIFSVSNMGQTSVCDSRFGTAPWPATSTANNVLTIDWPNTCNTVEIWQSGTTTATTTYQFINATTSAMAGGRKTLLLCNASSGITATSTFTGVEWAGATPISTVSPSFCDIYNFIVSAGTSSLASPTYKVFGFFNPAIP